MQRHEDDHVTGWSQWFERELPHHQASGGHDRARTAPRDPDA
jgi:hypothetical protein